MHREMKAGHRVARLRREKKADHCVVRLHREMKASYTVEASWVMSICMFIVFSSLTISIAMYKNAYAFVEGTTVKEIETVKMFRQIALGKDLMGTEQGEDDAD